MFLLRKEGNERVLVENALLEEFEALADLDTRKEIIKTIVVGFQKLPKYAFLGLSDMINARGMALDYDQEHE